MIVLEITYSKNEVIAGIPEYLEIQTNIASTVFYTLDGTDPTIDSMIALARVYMPTEANSVTFKAIAISGPMQSQIYEDEFVFKQMSVGRKGNNGKGDISILKPGKPIVDHLSYDEDGNQARETVIPIKKLTFKASTTDDQGRPIILNTTMDFINFAKENPPKEETTVTNINSPFFEPTAQVIYMDGSTQAEQEKQITRPINRPLGTFQSYDPKDKRRTSEQLQSSGGYVGTMRSQNGIMVSSYFDAKTCRWIFSKQSFEPNTISVMRKDGPPASFVFSWVKNRTNTKIY